MRRGSRDLQELVPGGHKATQGFSVTSVPRKGRSSKKINCGRERGKCLQEGRPVGERREEGVTGPRRPGKVTVKSGRPEGSRRVGATVMD